jgi:hypothetical protein
VTTDTAALRVDTGRLLADLAALARIGGRPDGGVDRVAGSPADGDRPALTRLPVRPRDIALAQR